MGFGLDPLGGWRGKFTYLPLSIFFFFYFYFYFYFYFFGYYNPRGDNPYQVLKVINNNAYKMIFLENSQHILLSIFNVADLSPFDVGDDFSDSRTNPFEEGEDDKVTVIQMFQLDQSRRFNKHLFFIYKIG